MKIYIYAILILFPYLLQAQTIDRQVIGSGGEYVGSSVSLSYNVGEPVINTLAAVSSVLTQGFEQPVSDASHIDVYSSIRELNPEGFSAKLYPNPAGNFLTLDVTSLEIRKHSFQLFTLLGQKISATYQTCNFGGRSTYTIDVQNLAAAPYLLTVIDDNMNIIHTFKFIKTN